MDSQEKKQKNIFARIFTPKVRKILLILLLDIAFAVAAFVISRSIIFRGIPVDPNTVWYSFYYNEVWIAAAFVAITVLMLAVFDSYNAVWRFAGRVEFIKIVVAYFAATGALFTFAFVLNRAFSVIVSAQLILMYLFFSVILSATVRYHNSVKNYIVHLKNRITKRCGKHEGATRVIVIGAGYSGNSFITRAFANPGEGQIPVALIDEDESKHGDKVHGVRVLGGLDRLDFAIKRFSADMIVIAIVNIPKSELKEIYVECMRHNLPVRVMTKLQTAEEASETATLDLVDIKIEELLGRNEFKVNKKLLAESVKGKRVLVTGGAGSIGSELCRQALKSGCKHLVCFDMHENGCFEINEEFKNNFDKEKYTLAVGSVRDKKRLEEVFEKFKPEIVFHAAAYKHVPMMEFSASEAIKNNVFGTINTIDVAEKVGAERFIFISTDKAVNPANVMGASKRIAEMVIQDRGKNSKMAIAAVRFGNVLGSNGSVIPIFLKQIKKGGPITLTDKNIKRYFMTIPEAVRLVLQAGALAIGGDVFVLDMGDPVYIYDLACDLIRLNGLEPEEDIKIETVGLRPGEKMFEELSYSKESVDTTVHEGIFVNKMLPIKQSEFALQLKRLQAAVDKQCSIETEEVIFSIVPSEYRHDIKVKELKTEIGKNKPEMIKAVLVAATDESQEEQFETKGG